MKKIISNLTLLIIFILIILIIILSTIGVETNKFNNFVSKKINQTNNNINLELKTIKFKFSLKEISLFLETNNPSINYRNAVIPAKNIKVYMDFISFLKKEPKIKKINLTLNQFDIEQLKKMSIILKPSNFTSFVNNKIKKGKINTEIEVYLDNDNLLDNFIARGSVSNLKAEIFNDINLEKTSFNFFADKTDILIKNFFSETGPIKIIDGDIKLDFSQEISLESNFKTNIQYDAKFINYFKSIKYFNNSKDIVNLEASLNNRFFINFDKTYKVKKYNYKSTGVIVKADLDFKKPLQNYFSGKTINKLTLINSEIKTDFSSQKNTTNILGKYSLNGGNALSFNLENTINKDLLKLKLNADYDKSIKLELINYEKSEGSIANIFINLNKQKNNIILKEVNFTEESNSFFIKNVKFDENKFLSLEKISVKTSKDGKKNNDFTISYGKKISIKGNQIDGSNLPKILNQKTEKNKLLGISKDIEIDFTNIIAPLSKKIKNFKLIGRIEKGKFTKISSKGDFGENNFLDITMKKDKKNKKKYLEIYSDLTAPLLSEYSFFKGLTGGNLLFSSIIDEDNSISKLKIEDFKVKNAPGMVRLLSLADLGGLADLSEGEGISFDILEINMEKTKESLKLNEILAIGPSVSVIMEGYQNPSVTSLRGTLVPAKTLNKIISKIPVIGNIIIPKEVGEGLFGISFKMKGPPGKVKTTINPIRTLTPRFIQKIIEKNKNPKQF
jgi:hypothetical protein